MVFLLKAFLGSVLELFSLVFTLQTQTADFWKKSCFLPVAPRKVPEQGGVFLGNCCRAARSTEALWLTVTFRPSLRLAQASCAGFMPSNPSSRPELEWWAGQPWTWPRVTLAKGSTGASSGPEPPGSVAPIFQWEEETSSSPSSSFVAASRVVPAALSPAGGSPLLQLLSVTKAVRESTVPSSPQV